MRSRPEKSWIKLLNIYKRGFVIVWVYTLVSVVVVSLISLIGVVTLAFNPERLKKMILYLVSFAVGGLFGDAVIHLIPEAFKKLGFGLNTSLLILAGLLLFFSLEKFLRWQHCHVPTSEDHVHPVVTLNLVGDAVHNFMDGIIIAASFSVSIPVGLTTTLAVILHEIPQEIGDFGILIHKEMSIPKALKLNFLTSLTAIAGAVLALWIGPHIEGFTSFVLPITAGGFLYIAGSDLIPELHHSDHVKLSTSLKQLLLIILGIAIMALLVFLD